MIDELYHCRFLFLFYLCIGMYPTSNAKIRLHIHIPLTIMSLYLTYRLILGDGSDGHPFILSMTTKSLLSVLNSVSGSRIPCVLHMDSTFKCNENEFPATLLGVSNAQRQFHLLSIIIVSHRTLAVYKRLITSLQHIMTAVLPDIMVQFQYCMTDCEVAEGMLLGSRICIQFSSPKCIKKRILSTFLSV
jgi:hypothetical protein